jgi:hypothetical protein
LVIECIYCAAGVIGGGDNQIGRPAAVAGGFEPVALVDITAMNYNAFTVQVGVFQVLGVRDLLIDAAVGVLAGVAALGIIEVYICWSEGCNFHICSLCLLVLAAVAALVDNKKILLLTRMIPDRT